MRCHGGNRRRRRCWWRCDGFLGAGQHVPLLIVRLVLVVELLLDLAELLARRLVAELHPLDALLH